MTAATTTTILDVKPFDFAFGDCAVAPDGSIHLFVSIATTEAPEQQILHVRGDGGQWVAEELPHCAGLVAAATADRLLYHNADGVWLSHREAGGTMPAGRQLSRPASPSWRAGNGDVVAEGQRWWAVWIEQAGTGEPFRLYQASTMTAAGGGARERITSTLPGATHSLQPSLALDSADPQGAILTWSVRTDDATVARIARARQVDAQWQEKPWVPPAPVSFRDVAGTGIVSDGGRSYGVYEDDSRIFHQVDPPAGARLRFTREGSNPRLAHAAGTSFVAWSSADDDGHSHVFAATASDTAITRQWDVNAGDNHDHELVALTVRAGAAVVFGVDQTDNRLWVHEG